MDGFQRLVEDWAGSRRWKQSENLCPVCGGRGPRRLEQLVDHRWVTLEVKPCPDCGDRGDGRSKA